MCEGKKEVPLFFLRNWRGFEEGQVSQISCEENVESHWCPQIMETFVLSVWIHLTKSQPKEVWVKWAPRRTKPAL